MGPQLRQRLAEIQICQAFAAAEAPGADGGDPFGQTQPGQGGAAVEGPIRQGGELVAGKADAGEGFAAGKGKVSQRFQGFGQLQLHQGVAAQEGAGADGRHTLLHVRQNQAAAAGEGAVADGFQRGGQVYLPEQGAALKGVVPDPGDALRHMNGFQAEQTGKTAVADGGDGLPVDGLGDRQRGLRAGVAGQGDGAVLIFQIGVAQNRVCFLFLGGLAAASQQSRDAQKGD